jgi:hypothetical protein
VVFCPVPGRGDNLWVFFTVRGVSNRGVSSRGVSNRGVDFKFNAERLVLRDFVGLTPGLLFWKSCGTTVGFLFVDGGCISCEG